MRKLFVLVEGQTEEAFVRDVLAPHLEGHGLASIAVLLKTKRVKSGGHFRGGVTSTAQVLGDLRRLLGDSSAVAVTTLLDYYGLPDDFPGIGSRPPGTPRERVAHVEAELARRIGDRRFIPHLVLHEYEAWIYAEPARACWVFDDAAVAAQLEAIATTAGGPELVDEGPDTAPSKRLARTFPPYRKPLHGPIAVGAIGLPAIRARCPHMAAWLERLEHA
ncbi:MAG: DUF4276 family protein [Sandaracinaceae bacterium]|nr:DUF4276 family protein [Sandaracinaceae bacterium]